MFSRKKQLDAYLTSRPMGFSNFQPRRATRVRETHPKNALYVPVAAT